MPFKLPFLWTDALVWLLVLAVCGYAWYASRHPHLAAPWRRVRRSRAGMASAVILLLFVLIGLADSLHFRPQLPPKPGSQEITYAVEVRSLLDVLLTPVSTRTEKTYSAPFATRSFSRETITQPDGTQARDYLRLQFAGRHLASEADRNSDVILRALSGIVFAVVLWTMLAGLLVLHHAHSRQLDFRTALRAILRDETETAWRAILIAAGVILLLAGPAFMLIDYYAIFGTDKVGKDVFYLALKSVRTALVIGTLTTLVTLPIAILLGIMAGYFRGWVDDVIQYVYTTLNSIPGVLLIAASVLMMQGYIDRSPELFSTGAERADLRLFLLCLILGVTSWTGLCRLLRGETLKLRELEYIQAARAFGVGRIRIILRHILPNLMHIVLIALVMDFSSLVLAEAVLSYVGVGVDPSMISFGTMINNARLEMAREPMVWWSLTAAFLFMVTLVLSANLFADSVRDAFDPNVRFYRRRHIAPAIKSAIEAAP